MKQECQVGLQDSTTKSTGLDLTLLSYGSGMDKRQGFFSGQETRNMERSMKEHRKRAIRNIIQKDGSRVKQGLPSLGNQLLPTFSAELKSAGCKSRPQPPPPAPWGHQRWPQWSQAGCCSSEEWHCHVGGASGQWVALGKDRQMEIRFREIWQPGAYQALLRMWRVSIILGTPEAEKKAM